MVPITCVVVSPQYMRDDLVDWWIMGLAVSIFLEYLKDLDNLVCGDTRKLLFRSVIGFIESIKQFTRL